MDGREDGQRDRRTDEQRDRRTDEQRDRRTDEQRDRRTDSPCLRDARTHLKSEDVPLEERGGLEF